MMFVVVHRDDVIDRALAVLAPVQTTGGIMGKKPPLDITIETVIIDNSACLFS